MVANNPGTLPSYSLTAAGVANVTNSVSLSSTTAWTRVPPTFGSEILNILGSHTPDLSLGIDPVAEPMLLAGAWYACRWAIWGLPTDQDEYRREYDLLRKPVPMDIVGCHADDPAGTKQKYHLGVLDKDNSIPFGWLCVGDHCPPHGTCYQAQCGNTYVWVTPEGLQGLSEFTLVLMDIATIDPTWLAQQKLQATVSVDLTLPGSKDGKSTITETWFACQVEQADGSTRILVQPFAEPVTQGVGNSDTFTAARTIQRSTLKVYGTTTGPVRSDTPAPPPPLGAPQSSHY
jgi:hypothetical protein